MSLRKLNRRILILCEGTTERFYASELRNELPKTKQRSIAIEISEGNRQDPLSLVNEAIVKAKRARKERNPYEIIWLFFDHDNWPQLQNAFAVIEKEEFKIAFTSLCLEHWFILHFENCGRAFQKGEEVERYLIRLWPAYHKTTINHFQKLKGQLPQAIERANQLNRRQSDIPVFQRNPYFTIPDLLEFFESLKSEV
jgi:hypothetical protein